MANRSWLESSRRSASLGLEVLERASRRSVDWTSTGASQSPTTTDEDAHIPLNDAFATIAEFMAQTTYHCKRFYESGCCTEPNDTEKKHTSRFHTRIGAGKTKPALFHLSPPSFFLSSGFTWNIHHHASMPESQQQTQLVSVKAGESINLTFNL
uniref:A kinase (PRKA) interacting protein 1 n=1 Tax=Amphiprion percula TaxID=161767 RepID=A0A3P8SQ99_AMPPE